MVTTNNEVLYEKLKLFRSHGISREEKFIEKTEGGWYYEQLELGYNYRMTDIQCALGISQLRRLDQFIGRRRELVRRYNEEFEKLSGLVLQKQEWGCNSSWHLYVVQIREGKRKEAYERLQQAGINVNVHYIPVYKHPYYQKHGYQTVSCGNAEELYQNIISLPLYYELQDEQQDYIITQVKRLFGGD